MNNATPARSSFVRIATLAHVKDLVADAKRVGYVVKLNGGPRLTASTFNLNVTDHSPEAVTPGAEVFRAVQVRPGAWAVSYALAYWEEPAPVLPATPENFAKHIHNHP